jgi:hypothetical protein
MDENRNMDFRTMNAEARRRRDFVLTPDPSPKGEGGAMQRRAIK